MVTRTRKFPVRVGTKGVRGCGTAKGYWTEEYRRYLDPAGRPFYLLTGHFVNIEPDADDTDEYWLARRHVSVVPVTPDQSCVSAIKPLSDRFNASEG